MTVYDERTKRVIKHPGEPFPGGKLARRIFRKHKNRSRWHQSNPYQYPGVKR